MHIRSQSGTLVGGDGSTDDSDASTAVTSKESATSAALKECEESSGKQLLMDFTLIITFYIFIITQFLYISSLPPPSSLFPLPLLCLIQSGIVALQMPCFND